MVKRDAGNTPSLDDLRGGRSKLLEVVPLITTIDPSWIGAIYVSFPPPPDELGGRSEFSTAPSALHAEARSQHQNLSIHGHLCSLRFSGRPPRPSSLPTRFPSRSRRFFRFADTHPTNMFQRHLQIRIHSFVTKIAAGVTRKPNIEGIYCTLPVSTVCSRTRS